MTRTKTAILVFPDVEVLDFCGPFEVFGVTRLDEAKRREEPSPFDVYLVAETADPVRATGGLRVVPDHSFETAPAADLLVVPGGWGTRPLLTNSRAVEWVKRQADGAKLTLSVCTGSLVLGAAGLLSGKRATTHWMALGLMRGMFPDVTVVDHLHWVEDGVHTSAGISAGNDLALRVVAKLCGEPVARTTARYME
ncbi:MAG: DJ-1/PfpI family protein [Gemmataceae bacterium]|nr:DJ-1/PfpI family protein [Gemmataceae bacterium]